MALLTPVTCVHVECVPVTAVPVQLVGGSSGEAELWTPDGLEELVAWFDASDAETLTLNGSNVSAWADKSGNDNHATQASAANQPATGVSTIGGLATLSGIDGAQKMLVAGSPTVKQCLSVSHVTSTNGATILVHGSNAAATTEFFSRASTPQVSFDGVGTAQGRLRVNGGSQSSSGIGILAPDVTDADVLLEGTLANTFSLENIIGRVYTAGPPPPGPGATEYMGELLWFSAELSNEDRQKVEGYLAHKWGLESKLPSDHPYKSSAPEA